MSDPAMGGTAMSETVHHVRYGWSETSLLGTRGMGPIMTTLPAELLASWDRLLREHVWAAPSGAGFTYLSHDGIGVLIRKEPTTSADGREGSAAHAVLGPKLTARTALGLTAWDGWHGAQLPDSHPDADSHPNADPAHIDSPAQLADPHLLAGLDWPTLEAVAAEGLETLRTRARELPAVRVADLLAQLLATPGKDYTIVGEADPLALICAFGDLIGQVPTFASRELDDTRHDLPTAVFLPDVASYSPVVATRRRLHVGSATLDPVLSPFAEALADAYATDGPRGIAAASRREPPASLDEARSWATTSQFVPGVLADLARLPAVSPDQLIQLAEPKALKKFTQTAAAASTAQLLAPLGCGLPQAIVVPVLREAVGRVITDPAEEELLAGLARFRPLPAWILAEQSQAGLDGMARVSRVLTTATDRRALLERAAQAHPLSRLIRWIAGHVDADPEGAQAVFSALCGRAKHATRDDVDELVAWRALVAQIRRMVESEQQVSAWLVSLLGALPKRALRRADVLDRLLSEPDAALLHALETLAPGDGSLARVRRTLLLAYYADHDLPAPWRTPSDDGLRSRPASWWRAIRRLFSDPGYRIDP